MKIYFFDRDSGIYQGEEFEDDALVSEMDNATTVVPPPSCTKGEIAVFDPVAQRWDIRDLAEFSRQIRAVAGASAQNPDSRSS